MLGFEIGQRKSGFYIERTDRITDRITEPSSTVLVYRCSRHIFLYTQGDLELNLVESNQSWTEIALIRLIWHQMKFHFMLNHSEKCNYN